MCKLWHDYQKLKQYYPVVDLGHKGLQIFANMEIVNRIIRVPGNQRIIRIYYHKNFIL